VLCVAGTILATCLGCAGSLGPYVSVDDYTPRKPAQSEAYVIRPGDLVDVKVFNQDKMSGRGRVRTDGKVTLPFLNDVEAAGYTTADLTQQLQTRLKDFINNPIVTVSVEEAKPDPVSVVGNVARPGLYQLDADAGVLQALAAAGGMNEFAHKDRIFVLRTNPETVRIRFIYQNLLRGIGKAPTFVLKGGDTLVVE